MDTQTFDRFTRLLADRLPRRELGGLVAGALAALGMTSTGVGRKKKKRKKRKKKKRKKKTAPLSPPGPCVPDCVGKTCGPDGCGGVCGLCNGGVGMECLAGNCVRYQFLTAWGAEGNDAGEFDGLTGIAAQADGIIIAADDLNHRI